MNRRDFLTCAGLGALSAGFLKPAKAASQKKPNILWICVEDMSAHMGCYGETTIKTPNIDRLA